MSSVCNNFVQNAWKKDYCSNCFKARDEHTKVEEVVSGKYHALPFQNRSAYFKSKPQGILRVTSKKNKKGKVTFPVDVSIVIGYGGDDWSDGEDFELSEDMSEDDTFPDTEAERELHKLTKMNTDFNTVKANLLVDGTTETKKSYTSLLLGKIQKDSEGKKKTLMVSVTPFGQESIDNNKGGIKTHERKAAIIPVINNSDNISPGYKTNIILSSFIKSDSHIANKIAKKEFVTETKITEKSLLEEISETLEQNRITTATEFTSKPTVVEEQMKSDVKMSFNENRDNSEPRKNGIVRNLPVTKTQERPKVNTVRPEFKFCKINIENNIENIDECSRSESLNGLDSTNHSFTSDDDSVNARTDSDDDNNHIVQALNITKMNEECLKIKVLNDCADKDSIDTSIDDIRKVDGQSDSLQDTYEESYTSKILAMPPILPKITRADIFSGEVSRELAGEPDGRADPDDTMEAPALPSSPIPTSVDPRPSFLHGMILDSRPSIPEKPKLPAKPLSVLIQTKRPHVTAPPQHNKVIMQLQQTLHGTKRFSHDDDAILGETIPENVEQITVISKPPLIKQDSDSSLNQSYNKRKAPRPPPSPSIEEIAGNKYQRNPTANVKSDSPVVREKEKRERASSSPKSIQAVNVNPSGNPDPAKLSPLPEPAPRRNISLSHDNLLIEDKRKGKYKFSIKKLLRMGSSKDLDKKDLTSPNVTKIQSKPDDIYDITPKPKPRLVIIHPLDLNGGSVEVVKSNNEITEGLRRLSHDDVSSIYSGSSSIADVEITFQKSVPSKPPPPPRNISQVRRSSLEGCPVKPARPPPPKSAQLQRQQKQPVWTTPAPTREDDTVYANLGEVRSAIAPKKPERTASMREREAQLDLPQRRNPLVEEKDESDDSNEAVIVEAKNKPTINNYDDVYNSERYDNDSCLDDSTFDSGKNNSDSDYEYVNHNARSSSPECDSTNFDSKKTEDKVESRNKYRTKSEVYNKNDVDTNTDYNKSFGTFNRATSLPYCGSETESEIYSPYSFYSCADVTEDSSCTDDYNGDGTGGAKNTTSKLRVRKGRSIVHKSLEDNYGAVVIANHEALAQVLEQVQQSAIMQPSLRGIKACSNLRWSDFTLTQEALSLTQQGSVVRAGKRVFVAGSWRGAGGAGGLPVTLMLYKEQMSSQMVSVQGVQPPTLRLHAVTEFCDLVPLQIFGEEGEDLVQATVVVLERTQIETVQSFGSFVRLSASGEESRPGSEESECVAVTVGCHDHEATFVLLQLVDGLKCLQARGVEEVASTLSSFVVCRPRPVQQVLALDQQAGSEDRLSSIQAPKTNTYGRLCLLQGLSEEAKSREPSEEGLCSLCAAGTAALQALALSARLAEPLQRLLHRERAHTLSQAKAVLEFALWGPLDVVQGLPHRERELSLQRWLDLERATVLHGLVGTRVQLNAFEQSHLTFLVRSNAKVMCEASVLLENIEEC